MILLNRLHKKIIFTVLLYLVTIGIVSNIFLSTYLLKIFSVKAEQLDKTHLETVKDLLDQNFDSFFSLAALCAYDPSVIWTVSRKDQSDRDKMRNALAVQEKLNSYIRASPVNTYVDRLILVGHEDFFVQAQARQSGRVDDRERVLDLPLYAKYKANNGKWTAGFSRSITPFWPRDCYAVFFPVYGYTNTPSGFLYLEAGLDMVANVLRTNSPAGLAVATTAGEYISPEGKLTVPEKSLSLPPSPPFTSLRYHRDNRSYRLDLLPLKNAELFLYNEVDVTSLRPDDRNIFYSIAIVIVSSLLAAGSMTLALSAVFTKPIQRLIGRIHKIAENDFSFDPDIEKSADELGQIGRAVNQMSGSIGRLLAETWENFRQQRSAELNLLQASINPHFLYNTLDSIQWMAKIQKNTAISGVTRSLINLLRNIAAAGDFISLEEELRLLEDYTAIMSLRYMGIFSFENNIAPALYHYLIPKLTLQPLVENAIIHGIAPSGVFGLITIEGRLEDSFLVLTVEDSGLGINQDMLKNILTHEGAKNKTSLNTMGIKNVHERLKLKYGEEAGLSFESIEGSFTRVTVRVGVQTAGEENNVPRTAG
jgi:two-component system sensor histidine kinase YesM